VLFRSRADGAYLVHPRNVAMMALGMDGSAGVMVDDSEAALARAAVGNVCPEAQPAFDAGAVLAELERDGVYGAVLIGRISAFDNATPPEADIAYCQVANDWLAETWAPYFDRAAPGIHLPYKDVAACVTELERAASMGLRPALLPDGMWDRPYHLAEWEPLWEAANDLQIPFTMHVGGPRHPPNPKIGVYPGIADVSWYVLCCGMGETLGWMTYNGMFEKYPDLHFVMTEGYAGWLAFAIQFFDHHWTDSRLHALGIGASPASPKIDCPPSFYLKRQAHATFMWDPLAVRNRDLTGLDCLLWGNDYPHNEGSFPSSREWIDKQFAGVPEHEVDQMVRGNAAKLFRINV
jgi:predicted TIM-barrel fold metal-dependent hydrolase